MKKQKRLKSVAWLQLPTNLFADERMGRLIKTEGAAGLGTYVFILSEIYRRHSHQMTRQDVFDLVQRGFTKLRLTRVLNDYGLFCIDDYSHVTSAIDCCNIDELINPSEKENKDEVMTEENQTESEKKTRRNQEENISPMPARIKKTQTQSSSSYRRRNCAAADDGPFKLNLSARRVASVDEIIEQMKTPSAWSEAVIMSSGFCKLLHDNWDKALRWFRLHITERSKEGEILTVEDARRYFADLIHHPTTAALIQNYLQQLADKDRPYPYEDPTSRPGHRSYLGGTPLPDDAPSRPGPRHEWVLGRWEEF